VRPLSTSRTGREDHMPDAQIVQPDEVLGHDTDEPPRRPAGGDTSVIGRPATFPFISNSTRNSLRDRP
jgi:hypothetical protein